ncbi:50S ribosomal protein L32e [Methanocalculus taiwanensis]|uniref:Large ribosomal subunit protein eL32 n=1 Tax=Methanocalculus taiwanensis TaxID=106207 RepID=A0ABD4TKG0_9EURY|nr:50S ribosomal protein L32e [Methanocalculus taiwanensis]MCQ1538674.1 50S ribosomal protein L32e [Methanocalculus taiwanensis]
MVAIRRLIRDRRAKRGDFKRQCLHAKAKLDDVWRRPRGGQSKQRKQKKAKGKIPAPGFAGPAAVRGFHPCGMKEALVMTAATLTSLDPETTAIRIGGTVGMKKRMEIQDKALSGGFKVLNPKVMAVEEPDIEEEEVEDDE